MKLVIATPGKTEEVEGTLKNLMKRVRQDLADRGQTPEQVQRHIMGMSLEMHRVRATTVADADGNFIASYRITR